MLRVEVLKFQSSNLLLHTCAYKLLCYNLSSDNIIHIISVISVHVIARGLIVYL